MLNVVTLRHKFLDHFIIGVCDASDVVVLVLETRAVHCNLLGQHECLHLTVCRGLGDRADSQTFHGITILNLGQDAALILQAHHHLTGGFIEHEERSVVLSDLDPFGFEFYLYGFFFKSAWGLSCHAERISVQSIRDALF